MRSFKEVSTTSTMLYTELNLISKHLNSFKKSLCKGVKINKLAKKKSNWRGKNKNVSKANPGGFTFSQDIAVSSLLLKKGEWYHSPSDPSYKFLFLQ